MMIRQRQTKDDADGHDEERGNVVVGFGQPPAGPEAHLHHTHSPQPAPSPPPRPDPVRGNPGPIGLACFGMTTCMITFIITGWSSSGFLPILLGYTAFFGGLGQFVAGVLELIKGNTFNGTAFISYGCFWMGYFIWKILEHTGVFPLAYDTARTGLSLWYGLWGFYTLFLFVITLRKNIALMVVFGSYWITYFLLIGGDYNNNTHKAAGWFGFLCGASAIYTAIAMLYKEELGISLPGLAPRHWI